MEKDVRDRLLEAMGKLRISAARIGAAAGVSDRTIQSQVKDENVKIPAYTLIGLLTVRPDISAEWLMRGEGEMLKTTQHEHNMTVANTHFGHHNNTNIGSGTQTVTTQPQLPSMTKEQAMAALIEQNQQILNILNS